MALVCGLAGCTGKPDRQESLSVRSPAPVARTGAETSASPHIEIPSWATRCMPRKKSYRGGVAAPYLGLTRDEALRLARRRGDNLYLVGSAGRCVKSDDLVVQSCKVAVVYDQAPRHRWDLPPWHRLPPSARIVAAERVSGYWSRGGLISKRPTHLCEPNS